MKTLRILVYGRVQGVNFRNMAKDFAGKIKVKGSVRNREDGSVEIVAQGESKSLDEFIKWLNSNPGLSKVERIENVGIDGKKRFRDFEILKEENFLKDQKSSLRNLGRRFLGS